MKLWLLPLALAAGSAMACPADGAKDAMAPSAAPAVAAKAPAKEAKAEKADAAKVAQKAAEQRKAL